jgi:hypothetical protein
MVVALLIIFPLLDAFLEAGFRLGQDVHVVLPVVLDAFNITKDDFLASGGCVRNDFVTESHHGGNFGVAFALCSGNILRTAE